MNVRELLDHAVGVLTDAHVPSPAADAELLVAHVLGLSRGEVQVRAVTGSAIGAEEGDAVLELVDRRAGREPLQHLTGRAAFRSLELAVGPGVFVPRPETELVAQLGIDALLAVPSPTPRAIDLGAGSGAIALALATEVPHSEVVAVENSPSAFSWARRNADAVGAPNLRLVLADLAEAAEVLPELVGAVDVVVSNPPYIPLGAVPRDPEVRLHDPEAALYGGDDGLDVVRAVSAVGRRLLRPGGVLVLEHGELQGADIRGLLSADGWSMPATTRDLLGRDRATTAHR